jgi:hypothetical protein
VSFFSHSSDQPRYRSGESVFTIYYNGECRPGRAKSHPNTNNPSCNVAVIRFNDDGSFTDPAELSAARTCIEDARKDNPPGVLVMVFVHGWHHDGGWDDNHFEGFRQALLGLACREAERSWRQIVGVYIGWRGRTSRNFCYSFYKLLTFWCRYKTARRIGHGEAFGQLISTLVNATKAPLDGMTSHRASQLIMMGHSMGAYIFETAFLSLLSQPQTNMLRHYRPCKDQVTMVESNGKAVTFPDLIVLLNSAAKSTVATDIFGQFSKKQLRKTVHYKTSGQAEEQYESPLLISATSESDWTTKYLFWIGTLGHNTDGHDPSLITHRLKRDPRRVLCLNRKTVMDYGQCWHCLRSPDIRHNRLQSVAIDLPIQKDQRSVWHARYRLEPVETAGLKGPFWIFQVPADIIKNHNDIYGNPRSNLLVMALAQATGIIISLADRWDQVFEPKETCLSILDALRETINTFKRELVADGEILENLPLNVRVSVSKWQTNLDAWLDRLYKVENQLRGPKGADPCWDDPALYACDILRGTAELKDEVLELAASENQETRKLIKAIQECAVRLHELCEGKNATRGRTKGTG